MYVLNYENYEPKSTRQQKIRSNDFTNLLPRVQLWYYERSMTSDEALCRTIVLDIDCRNWSTALGIAANQNYQGNIRDFAIRHKAQIEILAHEEELRSPVSIPIRLLIGDTSWQEFIDENQRRRMTMSERCVRSVIDWAPFPHFITDYLSDHFLAPLVPLPLENRSFTVSDWLYDVVHGWINWQVKGVVVPGQTLWQRCLFRRHMWQLCLSRRPMSIHSLLPLQSNVPSQWSILLNTTRIVFVTTTSLRHHFIHWMPLPPCFRG